MMDVFYEQQLLQALNVIDGFSNLHYIEYLVVEDDHLIDYSGMRPIYRDMTSINDSEDFALCLFLSLTYFADLHEKKRLFHGDIKPANIFFHRIGCSVETDSGSLIPLYDLDPDHSIYKPTTYTIGFASQEFVGRVRS